MTCQHEIWLLFLLWILFCEPGPFQCIVGCLFVLIGFAVMTGLAIFLLAFFWPHPIQYTPLGPDYTAVAKAQTVLIPTPEALSYTERIAGRTSGSGFLFRTEHYD